LRVVEERFTATPILGECGQFGAGAEAREEEIIFTGIWRRRIGACSLRDEIKCGPNVCPYCVM
jgi:hypothetical protein